jgi:hypothetical protein
MHLILGHCDDTCCTGVKARLEARGLPTRLMATPFEPPSRWAWRLGADGVSTRLAPDDGPSVDIDGVLVRSNGWVDPAGWEPADHAYMQSEVHAALLAWLAGLPCPVVNRASAALWYRHRNPLLIWLPLLRRCGLPTPETVVTDDPVAASDFGDRLQAAGVPGAVCTWLTREDAWLIAPADWPALAALQAHTPVCLAEPHGRPRVACIVGRKVIWNGSPTRAEAALEPGLRRLAVEAGLDFLEVAAAPLRRGPGVVLVEPLPRLEHFDPSTHAEILDALTGLLVPDHAFTPAVQEAHP